MKVIPVLDLASGMAVHAQGGDRARYGAVRSALAPETPGDAVALAAAFRRVLGADDCYVADLDAIEGRGLQDALLGAVGSTFGGGVWVDAGVRSAAEAERVVAAGAAQVVVGTETLPSARALADIVAAIGADRVTLSLDLKGGMVLGALGAEVLDEAVGAAVQRVIVLDLDRVGAGSGPHGAVLAALAGSGLPIEVYAGGGVRDVTDLRSLEGLGVAGALVGTAIHAGAVRRARLSPP